MIRMIIKKILKSYKKRLENVLDTQTSTPPSSDDEDANIPIAKCVNQLSIIPPTVNNILSKVNVNKIKKLKSLQNIEKDSFLVIDKI